MDTKKIEVLLESVNAGSIKKAAEKLEYSPSALLHMMNSLENEIGFPLLTRSYNGVTLSPYGKQLLPTLQLYIECDKRLQKEIQEMSDTSFNKIRIVSLPSIASYWLPAVIAQLSEAIPEIELELSVSGPDLHNIVKRGDADFGFIDSKHVGDNEWMPIKKDQYYAVIPITSPLHKKDIISIDELIQHKLLIPTNSYISSELNELKKVAPKKNILASPNDGFTLLNMVSSGLGIAMLSQLYQSVSPSTVRMIPTNPPIFRRLGIIAPSFKELPPVHQKFISYFKEFSKI